METRNSNYFHINRRVWECEQKESIEPCVERQTISEDLISRSSSHHGIRVQEM